MNARRCFVRVRGSAARPPGASRCCARTSLRAPSRPHPPHDGASPAPYIPGSEAIGLKGSRPRIARRGGSPREGAQSTPKRGSPRGVGSEVRAQQRLAAGGAAPPTRIKCASYISAGGCKLPRPVKVLRRVSLELVISKRAPRLVQAQALGRFALDRLLG